MKIAIFLSICIFIIDGRQCNPLPEGNITQSSTKDKPITGDPPEAAILVNSTGQLEGHEEQNEVDTLSDNHGIHPVQQFVIMVQPPPHFMGHFGAVSKDGHPVTHSDIAAQIPAPPTANDDDYLFLSMEASEMTPLTNGTDGTAWAPLLLMPSIFDIFDMFG
ncbi:hypothetical protein HDE_00221 [Halotydeus destructor]|nr:hypothetical protein HDE_00221 [Halotydeus destructor]